MKTFSSSNTSNFNNNTPEFDKMLKEKELLKEEKKEAFKKRLKYFIIFLIIALSLAFIVFLIKKIPRNELMCPPETFEVYDLNYDNDDGYISLTYIDTEANNKICQKRIYNGDVFKMIHLSEIDSVTVEKYGHDGKVKKRKITQFNITDETYKTLSEQCGWKGQNN